ncbi:Fic family protein [Flammeovirga pacifica]|uniref:Fido domain-containing protein n=1 Tax=Flammeovirga pacifica TaxID=915059 RepID=A0A1S1YT18_FLAPC|nr:Fic/DOC family N-terminal domain-containing protein [Flammeovirga pacifica]OHX64169.1 hypothetical protein NH26_21430 [Flammeovirga pacifica]
MFDLNDFPDNITNLETIKIFKKMTETVKYVERLNQSAKLLPNPNILLNTLSLREAKESSEIENIVTTYDKLYTALEIPKLTSQAEKEVLNYKAALNKGLEAINSIGILTESSILEIQKIIVGNNQGLRNRPGTVIKNDVSGEIIFTPPQTEYEVKKFFYSFTSFFNNDPNIDALIEVALLHFYFECIHPFFDGNGRTGRILNILYLIHKRVIDYPILYLSHHINNSRTEYYKHLKNMNQGVGFEEYVIYFLNTIEDACKDTINLIDQINKRTKELDALLKEKLRKAYDPRLIDLLFIQGYTRLKYLEDGLSITRVTASKLMKSCVELGILREEKKGKDKIYINIFIESLIGK